MRLPERRHFFMAGDREQPLPRGEIVLTRMMADFHLLAVHAQPAPVSNSEAHGARVRDFDVEERRKEPSGGGTRP